MKELSMDQMNQVAGGSVHWHKNSKGKISGGGDSLNSLPKGFLAHDTNKVTNQAVAGAIGGMIGTAFGPAGAAAGLAIGYVAGILS
ncbi:hypothetical protein [Serratia ureilytica]|uniref:hypothetical protein n=1 Tax=Serratia ureilytica TaxID=300181 RepID=UPI0018670257|nr:hypothetical protein [Serratia ureilytica]